MGGEIGKEVTCEVIDNYAVKLLTIGYPLATMRRIMFNGIRGYE